MAITIPIPAFRGRTTAYATRAPVITGSITDPADRSEWSDGPSGRQLTTRTLRYAGVPHSFAHVVLTVRGLTSDLDSSEWLHDDGGATLPHRPFGDDEFRWQLQYREDDQAEWADCGTFLLVTKLRLQYAVGTVASLDMSSGQVGPMCQLVMGDDGSIGDFSHGAGEYRAVATQRTRGPGGAFFTNTHTSDTWTLEDSAGTVYYIASAANGGDDANDGLTPSTPWLTYHANAPLTGPGVFLIRDGDTIDVDDDIQWRVWNDRHFGVYGVAAQSSPTGATLRAVDGGSLWPTNRLIFEANFNDSNDSSVDCTWNYITCDANRTARGGWANTTSTSDADCVVNGMSWSFCKSINVDGGTVSSKGWDLAWGGGDDRMHVGLSWLGCEVLGDDNTTDTSKQYKQQIYVQGGYFCGWVGCTFSGATMDPTLDHAIYANNVTDAMVVSCDGDPNNTGLRQRGFLANFGINEGHTVPKHYGVYFALNNCSGCKLGLDAAQSQGDAGAGWDTHWYDDVLCEANYMRNAGTDAATDTCNGIMANSTCKNQWVRGNVANNVQRNLYSYSVNTNKLSDASQQYDDLPAVRMDNNYVYNSGGNGGRVIEVAAFAKGAWDIDFGYVTFDEEGGDRQFARYNQSYMDSAEHIALGGGIRRGTISVTSPESVQLLNRTITDAPTYAEDEEYIDQSALETDYPAVTFQSEAFSYDDPANEDFGGLGEPPDAPAAPTPPAAITDLPFKQLVPIDPGYGDTVVPRTLLNDGNMLIVGVGDSFTTPGNVVFGRLLMAYFANAPYRLAGLLLANQYLGAAGAYEFANVTDPSFAGYGKFGQQPFCALQHHLDLNAGDAGDPVGMHIGNLTNNFNHFDSGSGPLFAKCFHQGGWVSIHSDATVLDRAPAQNEYYRHIVESTHITRFGLMRNPFLTGTENIGVRPLYLLPGPDAAGRNTYTDNVLRTFVDLSGTALTDALPGAITDHGITFRGNNTPAWRDQTGGTSQAGSTAPTPATVHTLYGTGDKATTAGDLFVEPVSNAYAWGIRHNSAAINAGDFLPAVGPVLAYRTDSNRAPVPGHIFAYTFGNSNDMRNVGAGQTSGLDDADQKNTLQSDINNLFHAFSSGLDRDGVLIWGHFAEEGSSLATQQACWEAVIEAARDANPGKPVYLLLFTSYAHKGSAGEAEADARARIESNRDKFRTLADTLRGTGTNQADAVYHFSLYDAMRGHLLYGGEQATAYLQATGGTAFTRPGGGGPVDFTDDSTNEYDSVLLDPLHIEDQTGATTNDRNRAGEYIGSQIITLLSETIGGGGFVRYRSLASVRRAR
jgi:hypothetical protein